MAKTLDTTTLEMALIGYEVERQKIVGKILELELQLKDRAGRARTLVAATSTKRGRRSMSAAARKRIAAAQKARWAAYRRRRKAA